jgi:hypothetical protein
LRNTMKGCGLDSTEITKKKDQNSD